MSESTLGEEPTGDVNDVIANALLNYVDAAMGRDGLQQLVDAMPDATTVAELVRGSRWWPAEEFQLLTATAAQITGNPHIGEKAGEQSLRNILGGPHADMLRTAGSTEAACAIMADYSTRVTKGRVLTVVESSPSHVVIEGVFTDGAEANAFACDFSTGYFGSIPLLFDELGTCIEITCQTRGDDKCRYRVAWRPDPRRAIPASDDDQRLVVGGASTMEELERTHRIAASLVESHEIDETLERMVNSVSGAVGAPQYLLAVRLDDGAGRRVHQVGFDGDGAEVVADMIDAGEELGENYLVVEVRHGERVFGHLVAVFLAQARSTPYDKRMLRSYASFAAAAIQIVEAVDAARRDRDTATAMLGLATALAETVGVESVVDSLCAALPTATGCGIGTVWLADPATGELVLTAATDRTGNQIPVEEPARIDPNSLPGVREPLVGPTVVDLDHPDHRATFGGGDDFPFVEAALVPIGPIGSPIAMAGAIFERHLTPAENRDIGDRLRGLASQATVAFENARLIEATRHQALHDDLTGLPKRALAEDRGRQALARRQRTGEEVALLFIDVDDFKVVNDTHGHATGDALLRSVAARLDAELRSSDTCARVGGDEFVVILTSPAGTSGGAEVAQRLIESLDAPFSVGDHTIEVTASIGIAWAGPGAETFDELVARADGAMYEAKAQGKARLVQSR